MEPAEYSNCLSVPVPPDRSSGAADSIEDDDYSNIYQDVLVSGDERRNRGNSFQEARIETSKKPNKEMKAEADVRRLGLVGHCWRAKRLVVRFWPLIITLLLMWLVLLTVTLVKYQKLSAMLKTANVDHSSMITNFSSGLSDAKNNHEEMKGHMEKELATLRTVLERLYDCPEGWKKHKSNCYLFSTTEQTWESAKENCINQYSRLVVIDNQQEQTFLAQSLNGNQHWIGLTDSPLEGMWHWVTGANLVVSFWGPGEPNNAGAKEHCATIEPSSHWNDIPCAWNRRWICEKELF
ncbi:CD209 antigen-like protein C isoform X3 [Ambystoma mexicanum]|uniref:CD209 antigen-like protein C isoform X3 n=1 Tax=Ambystoma mexicanum TaxID=8296 RepID=UPI0037E9B003